METKYGFNIPQDVVAIDIKRLVNQMWKLIPMKENGEDWEQHLTVVIEEISGLHEVLNIDLDFVVLLSKLEGLRAGVCDEDFMLYRKTVFRCIDLLAKVVHAHES